MEKIDYEKEFLSIYNKFNQKYSKWEVWKDFLYLSAASMANTVKTAEWQQREERYLQTIGKYEKEYQEMMPNLFAVTAAALDDNPEQDFLGKLYHRIGLEQEQKGQFFTPYHICEFMSEINYAGDEMLDAKTGKKYITVSDPACGAGAMLIAFANTARKYKINYQDKVLFVAQDIDETAMLMCYVQLSLLGCNAAVIRGDSLAKPGFHPDNDVWFTPMLYLKWEKFRGFFEGTEEATQQISMNPLDMKQFVEEASGQMTLAI